MLFLQPAWLMLLAPWAALVVLCLREFRPKALVPFLDLWPAETPQDSKQRFWRAPPWAIVLLLLALLTIIGALAGPKLKANRPVLREMTVIVDRGVTMLAGGRLQKAVKSLSDSTEGLFAPDATIHVEGTGESMATSPSLLGKVLGRPATALSEHDQLRAIAAKRRTDGPVVLLSDMAAPPGGVIPCVPEGRPENVGILSATVNQGKCLLTIRNDSSRAQAHVQLLCAGGQMAERDLDLPQRGRERSYTLKLPGELLKVMLRQEDDLADDNVRWLIPPASAALVLSAGLPERVQRFAQSYFQGRKERPVTRTIRVTSWSALPERDALVVAAGRESISAEQTVFPDHPVLREFKAPAVVLAANGEAMRDARAAGWRALMGSEDRPLLAVDDEHHRAWIGFEPAREEDVADWLILLTNLADHLASQRHSTSAPRVLGDGWKRIEPGALESGEAGTRYGVYQRGDERVVINVEAPVLRQREPSDVRASLLAQADAQSRIDLARWLWLLSAVMVVAAVGIARR